jgi:hypothetical protein
VIVTEAVTELEAERVTVGLELGAGFQELIPGVRKLVEADLLEPVHTPVHQLPDIAEGNGLPFAIDDAGLLGRFVPTALLLADLLGDVADVDVLLVVEERPIEEVEGQVGAASSLGDGGNPGLQAANACELIADLDAGELS